MNGIVASKGLWWCAMCSRPVISEAVDRAPARLATYDDFERIVMSEHAQLFAIEDAARGFLWALSSANGTEGPDLREENLEHLREALEAGR